MDSNSFMRMEFSLIKCKSLVVCRKVRLLVLVLFLQYINDLPLSSNFVCNIFADDIALFISDNDPTNLEKKANIELNPVFSWLQKTKLTYTLNLSKTKVFYSTTITYL